MCSFLVCKNACLNYSEFDLEGDLVAVFIVVFIGPVFRHATKTCLKREGHCGDDWVEKELCRFAEDMS